MRFQGLHIQLLPNINCPRPFSGQATLLALNAVVSPTEKVVCQISVIEFGLRRGGHINSLTGVYEELA